LGLPVRFGVGAFFILKMEKESNIEWWEKLLENIPDSYANWFKEEEKFLKQHITKDAKVLEIGCGEGRSLNYILDITKNIVGIDNDPKAVKDAKANLKDIDIQLADGKNLPFEDNSFDFVICMTTPANFGDEKQKFYAEMKRVVKEEGQILLSVFNEDAMEERLKLYKKVNAKVKEIRGGRVIFEDFVDIEFSEQFSKSELENIFKEAGLKVLEIKKEVIGYFCRLGK
jgi:ubiquinone/menaquinone biosynthesis C-methylase UbiE